MSTSMTRVAELERQLEEAGAQVAKEDGERYRVIWREISEYEKARILEGLTERKERVLFGLEVPEERKTRSAGRPGTSGGDLTCSICGKSGHQTGFGASYDPDAQRRSQRGRGSLREQCGTG